VSAAAAENRRKLEALRAGGARAERFQAELARRNAERLSLGRNGRPNRAKVRQ
jgi:hypothetical protein